MAEEGSQFNGTYRSLAACTLLKRSDWILVHALPWRDLEIYQRGDSGQAKTKQQTMTAGNMAEDIINLQFSPTMFGLSGTP